jgi:hypothetical protein
MGKKVVTFMVRFLSSGCGVSSLSLFLCHIQLMTADMKVNTEETKVKIILEARTLSSPTTRWLRGLHLYLLQYSLSLSLTSAAGGDFFIVTAGSSSALVGKGQRVR